MSHSAGRLRTHQSGERIGDRYQVAKLLGQGGFGSVYEVEDTVLKIKMACKEMDLLEAPAGLAGDRELYLQNFLREATALKTLHHPNIPSADYLVVQFGQWVCPTCGEPNPASETCAMCHTAAIRVEQRHYVLMRFVDGDTLESRYGTQGRPLTWDAAQSWFLQVCSAVGELHRQNLLHRDIKPENVVLERNGDRAYLLDLGLVKCVDAELMGASKGKTRVLSAKTQAIGTPGYAAPELYRGQSEPASDVFALAMLLYWALTGCNPGDEAERTEMLQQTPRDFNDQIPQFISDAIVKGIKVRPRDRYGSVNELTEALRGPMATGALPSALGGARQTAPLGDSGLSRTKQLEPDPVPPAPPTPAPYPAPVPVPPVPVPAPTISLVWPLLGFFAFLLAIGFGIAFGLGLFPWMKGALHIASEPSGAEVWDGSKSLGRTPLDIRDLPAGPHRFRLELIGCESQTINPQVEMSKSVDVKVTMVRLDGLTPTPTPTPTEPPTPTPTPTEAPTPTPTPTAVPATPTPTPTVAAGTGSLQIESTPTGARVEDSTGKDLGVTPLTLTDLRPGPMTLVLQLVGHEKKEVAVTIEANTRITRTEPLSPAAPAPVPGLTSLGGKNRQGFYEYRNDKDDSVLILIPAGSFVMGSDASTSSFPQEQPSHSVQLSAYYIGRTPVTLGQYQKFCAATGTKLPPKPVCPQDVTHPVVNVSWTDAQAYCNWANLRLPTEAEWERCAKGPAGQGARYPWGAADPHETHANFGEDSVSRPVGSFPEGISGFGCLDMSGSVWQWCSDWYDANYFANSPAANPTGASEGKRRVARGGGYGLSRTVAVEFMRSGCRWSYPENHSYANLGFRVALSGPK